MMTEAVATAAETDVVAAHGDAWSRKSTRLRDVPLEISARIGRTRLPIRPCSSSAWDR